MLSIKLRRVVLVFAIVVVVVLALFIGFRLGFSFIAQQNARIEAVQAMEQAAIRGDTVPDPNVTPTPAMTDSNGEAIKAPRHIRQDTPGAVEIYIERGMDPGDIADLLLSKEVIDQTLPFVVVAELNGFGGRYQLGTHFVLKGMDYNEIMYNLALPAETTWVTFPEGYTYIDIKRRLKEQNINFDEAEMDRLVNTPSLFTDFSFITDIPTDSSDRIFTLEGYLFPDTYQFDLNVSEEDIIRTILRNTENRLSAEIRDRASAIGMSIDQLLTMASVIENESGKIEEHYLVSRVFHNRLDREVQLQSCATTNYLRQLNGKPKVWAATQEDMASDNPYNTYRFHGLPPGPISNPGLEAIKAALYPDQTEKDLMYFVAKGDGTNAFASNLAGHEQNIAQYSDNWSNPRD